ncbi:TfuA-like protein [Niveispirillum sp. BGYR6]|uniref:TfuA-like protein n=1 Tax=Niveispirillum sp. BGYR6 TaxID=2971249 RepID=UPI0022B94BDF|nr:TfuA-like protein [Niveispirillum sp. BGYR6]MDG5493950.1 TfuA-like protein [Niveispirillum sp. BGYR6]
MSHPVIVFLGPTLASSHARRVLEADYRGPVAQGDVLRAVMERPAAIAIIDGYFANVPSVWHKEILYALSQGIPVLGAASMGALRAAELHPFGMQGVGAIFQAYVDGRLEDDDEVAVTHGPAELGYPLLSEAMVNIRRTLSDAMAAEVLTSHDRSHLQRIAKDLPYQDRSYGRLLRDAVDEGLDAGAMEHFRGWLAHGRADQKREDALALLSFLGQGLHEGSLKVQPGFAFEHTFMWEKVARPLLSTRA